jgi:cysteine desulfurase
MLPYLRSHPGDPGRLHAEGRVTRVAVEDARERVAALFGARPREVVFTATGTESVNHAIWGGVRRAGTGGRIVTTAVEHSAVLDACRREPGELTIVGVDAEGRLDPEAVEAAIAADTVLVSVQLANHEVGTIQPVAEICARAHARSEALVHVDACAAAGQIPVDFSTIGADLLSVTGHTWGAPKGCAALLVRRGLRVPPLVVGGAQERARRGGIEDVPAIVGFGAAAAEVAETMAAEQEVARTRTERVAARVTAEIPDTARLGATRDRLPHLVCLGIGGVEAEPVLLALDQRGIAVHSGSSCSSEALEPSPVLTAMGADAERSLRVSVGWSTTDADVDRLLAALPDVVARLRSLRP